jgi:hypothetical protein
MTETMALVSTPHTPAVEKPVEKPVEITKGDKIKEFCGKLLQKLTDESAQCAKSEKQEDKVKGLVYLHLKEQLTKVFSDQAILTGFIVHVLVPHIKERIVVNAQGKKVKEKYLDTAKFTENQNKAIDEQIKEALEKNPNLKGELTKEKVEKARAEFAFINKYFEAIACTYLL